MKKLRIKRLLSTYKSIGIISLSSIVGAVVTFTALPFITRLYSLKDFAEYGLAISIVSVCSVVTMLRLEQALLIIKTKEEQYKLIFESIILSSIIVVLLGVIFLIKFTPSFVLCLISGIFSNNLVQLIYNMNFSLEKEYFCASINIIKTISLVIMQLLSPVIFSFGLIDVYTYNSLLFIVLSLVYFISFKCVKISFMSFLNYKDFIFSSMPHAFLNSFSHNLPYYVVGIFLNTQLIGMYMIVERVLKTPIGLFSQTIRQFYIRKFRQEANNKLALKHSIFMSLVSFPFFAIFMLIPDAFYVFIFGNEWNGVAEIFSILTLGYWAIFCNPPASAYLIATRKSHILLYLQLAELVLKIGLFLMLYFYLGDSSFVLLAVPISLCFYNFMILYKVNKEGVYV